jgi:Tol biopolymer transport system component
MGLTPTRIGGTMRIGPIVSLSLAVFGAVVAPAGAEDNETRFIRNARQLTFEGRRAGEGYFSADGNFLVFQSEREPGNPFYQIYTLSFETGDVTRVSPGKGKTTCAWFHPHAEQVLFASTHQDPLAVRKQEEEYALRDSGKERRYAWDYDSAFDIFTADRDGSNIHQLTTAEGYDAEGSFSPDGKTIAFCSTRDAYPAGGATDEVRERREVDASYFGEIYIVDASGESPKRLTDWPGYDGGPFFSPDGDRIVWRHFSEDGSLADIYTMRTDGSDRRQITGFGAMCWAPFYHPSGKYIIFTSNKLGFSNFELYIVDTKGEKEPVRVTSTDGFDGLPVFSADGERISWTSNRTHDEKSQIFIGSWSHTDALNALDNANQRGEGGGHGTAPHDSEKLRVAGYTKAGGDKNVSPMSGQRLRESVTFLAADELEG